MSYPDIAPQPPGFRDSPYVLSRDEKRVLRECARESFYNRCVPFMTVLGLGAYYGVHLGYLRRNNNYGATPKVISGIIIGFIAGKLSYKDKCEEKILALPGGRLKEMLLTKRSSGQFSPTPDSFGFYGSSYNFQNPNQVEPHSQPSSYGAQNLPPYNPKSSALSSDRPMDSFDDSFRIRPESANDDIELTLPTPPPSYSTTYDELRHKNRLEYENQRRQYRSGPLDDHVPYSGKFISPSPSPFSRADFDDQQRKLQNFPQESRSVSTQALSRPSYVTNESKTSQRKNFYGDLVEE